MTSELSIRAITFMLPPQTLQVSMSILNTRFKRCAYTLLYEGRLRCSNGSFKF